jgi:hypothetical protein
MTLICDHPSLTLTGLCDATFYSSSFVCLSSLEAFRNQQGRAPHDEGFNVYGKLSSVPSISADRSSFWPLYSGWRAWNAFVVRRLPVESESCLDNFPLLTAEARSMLAEGPIRNVRSASRC